MKLILLLFVSAIIAGTANAAVTPGLSYSYYEGTWTTLPNFFSITPVKKGTTANIDLSVRKRTLSYAFLWQGNIVIPTTGEYTFAMNSDDGSKLFIGTYGNSVTPLINIDGLHANKTDSGTITLTAGTYPITIAYFQADGGQTMEVYWSSNKGLARQRIPDKAFTHPAAFLSYSYYEGNWNALPEFSLLKAVKTGSVTNFDLGIRRRDTSYGVMWRGFITIPANGTYTFETNSDDGSKLYLYTGKTTIVNNDGLHPSKPVSGSVVLNAGTYPINVSYFQKDGGHDFRVYWSSTTGIERQIIPDIAFMYPSTVVNYKYYEGTWNTLPDFNRIVPAKIGMGVNIDLSVRSRDSSYGVMWNSFINIPATGIYTFETSSDDGSKLYIKDNGTPLVNNDGIHGTTEAKGTISLNKGAYPITVTYFQNGGGNKMDVYWSSNKGLARQLIPNSAFVIASPVVTAIPDPNQPVDTSLQVGMKGIHNYYFSSTTGDDMRSSVQAQNAATPWKTISQLNDFFPNLLPGDAVLFKRGDVFTGTITVSKSGTKGSPIIFSAYGSGDKPVVNGFATVTGWTAVGGNVYEGALEEGTYLNCVIINNIVKAMGRYPNSEYLTIDSRTMVNAPSPIFTGPGTFTDAELPASVTNWTGGEAVIRKNVYIFDRGLITGHSGTTITYNSPSPHTPEVGFGYFIQNHRQTLDAEGEWYYDGARKKLLIYTTKDPYTLDVRGSVISSLVTADNKTNVIFDNLGFQGADTSVFNVINGCSDITIQNCIIKYSGMDVLHGINSSYLSFLNNVVYNTNSSPVYLLDCQNSLVKGNTITHIGILPGMGLSTFAGYGGIYVKGSNTTIENNIIDSVGYNGIVITGGDNILVKNNFVSDFCMILADGGGIYTNGDNDFVGRRIIGNVITNGLGSYKGTLATEPRAASGVYIDELGSNVEVADNTIYNCVANGIYLHQAYDNIIRNNTIVNNRIAAISIVDDQAYTARIRNNDVFGNILYAKDASQLLLNHGSTANDLTQFGRYDSNYFCRPFDLGGYISTQFVLNGQNLYSFYDLESWAKVYPDKGTQGTSAPAIASYNVTKTGTNIIANGTFNDNVGSISTDGGSTVTLDAKLDGKAAKFTVNGSVTPSDLVSVIDIGPVTPGTTYRIKFSLLGSGQKQNLTSYVRSYDNNRYPIVSGIKRFALKATRTECEYLYKATTTEPDVKLTFVVPGTLLPYWIDNVEVALVDVTYNNIDDSIRFEFNPTASTKTIVLAGSYTDYKNKIYTNQVTIKPYSSILLTKVKGQNSQALVAANDSVQAALSAVEFNRNLEFASLLTESIKAVPNSSVYPNPAIDVLATRIYSPKTGKIFLNIQDQAGRTIQSSVDNKKGEVYQRTLNVSALHPGLYYLQIKFNDGTSMVKSFLKK